MKRADALAWRGGSGRALPLSWGRVLNLSRPRAKWIEQNNNGGNYDATSMGNFESSNRAARKSAGHGNSGPRHRGCHDPRPGQEEPEGEEK